MTPDPLSTRDLGKLLLLGVANALLLSAIMVPAFKAGVSPLPEPLGLAFAQTLLGRSLPLPVGLLLHVIWVAFWSAAYVLLFRPRLTFSKALALGLGLWLVALVVFFPMVGWGFLGLGISPELIPASLIPHLLFAVFLWGLCRSLFPFSATPKSGI